MKTAGLVRASISGLALLSLVSGVFGQAGLYPDPLWVKVIFYDYYVTNNDSNPDFQQCSNNSVFTGMVYDTLDAQHKPVPTPLACPADGSDHPCACHLREWFRVSGNAGSDPASLFLDSMILDKKVSYWTNLIPYQGRAGEFTGSNFNASYDMRNIIIYDSLPFAHQGNGVYQFRDNSFFKLDGRGFGTQPASDNPNNHNFGFTMELHTTFTYRKGLTFSFTGDDDVWAYVNGKLIMDLGGVHGQQSGSFNLDNVAGLEEGKNYDFDFFYAERHTTASNILITSNIISSEPIEMKISVEPNDTIMAGQTATILGTLMDQFNRPMPPSFNDSIIWTLDPATVKAGDVLQIPRGDTTRFTATMAHRSVNIIGRYGNGVVVDTATLYILPNVPKNLVIEPSLPPPLNNANRMGTTTIGPTQTTATGYAVLRDTFMNYVRYSTRTQWGSNSPAIITIPENGGGNAAQGQGIFTRVGPDGTARVGALDLDYALRDTVSVVVSKINYDSLRIVVNNTVQIQDLQMRSDQDTLLQVVGKQSTDGRWVPVPGNWIYNALLGDTTVSGQSSWRFRPGDTGTGKIIVSMGTSVPDTIAVKILPGLPSSVVLYNSESAPGPTVVKLGDPGQVIPIVAGTQFLLVAKVFDWKGVWLTQYQDPTLTDLQKLFFWGASDRAGSLNSTLDGLTGAIRRFTPTKAWDTVTIIDTLKVNGGNLIDTVRFVVNPGPAKRLVIESKPNGLPTLNDSLFKNDLDTLRILSNEPQKPVLAILRDAYGNYVSYSNVSAWGSLNTQVVSVVIGDGNIGEGIAVRFPTATDSITRIHAFDAVLTTLMDSCYVKLEKYYYEKLRILIGNDTNPAKLTMNTNQDTTIRVQGLRSSDKIWVDVPARWENKPNLTLDPVAPVANSWRSSPFDTGTGWIRVTLNNDGVTIPDTLPVFFTPGPPVRASIEIITPPDSIIAGKPIQAAVRVYDKDGHSYTYAFDTTAGKAVTYRDALGTGGVTFPEPFIIVDGDTVFLAPSSTDRGNELFLNGRDTVTFTLFNAPFDTTQKHQITVNLTVKDTIRVGGNRDSVVVYTVTSSSTPFVLHPDKLAEITIIYPDGTPVTDTLRLTDPITIISRGYDKYGNRIGDIIGTWSVTDSLHQITGPVIGSSITYDPRTVFKNERGYIFVTRDGVKDSIYVIITGPLIRLVRAVTRDTSGNGILDRMELYFSRKFELPANASFTGLTIIANGRDTLVVNRILNTGGDIDDSVWVVELVESHANKPQTGWTPSVHLPSQSAYDLADRTVVATDGAGPVVWRVENHNVLTNSHEQDTVVVTFSEPVQRSDGGNLTLSDKPVDIFYVWTQDQKDTTRYILVKEMLAGTFLKHDPGKSNTLVFTMNNGNDLNRGYFLSLADSANKYVSDTTVGAVRPNTNNIPRRVEVIPVQKDPYIPFNPIGPVFTREGPGVFNAANNENALTWVRDDRGRGAVIIIPVSLPPDGETEAKLKFIIKIYDVIGNVVQSNENPDFLDPAKYGTGELKNQSGVDASIYWNGSNEKGMAVAPGVYRVVMYLKYSGLSSANKNNYKDKRMIAKLGIQR